MAEQYIWIVTAEQAGKRLDSLLAEEMDISRSTAQQWLEQGLVTASDKPLNKKDKLKEGIEIQVEVPEPVAYDVSAEDIPLDIVYEDDHILLVNKPVGLVVHEDESQTPNTLINQIKAYLYNKGAWDPRKEASFTPSLCNRIDRNTGGIVIAAKTAAALRVMNDKIKDREISKYYLCLVHGKPRPAVGELTNYLRRDMDKKQVFVEKRKTADSLTAKLRYRTLDSRCDLSLVECELLTGRTHQIRVQMSAAGHPLVGDTKYGTIKQNKGLPYKHQALWSYRLRFDFPTDAGELEYLRGKEFQVQAVPFLDFYYGLPKK